MLADAGWGDVVIQLYSFSKAYAVPGHRLGAMLAAPETMAEIAKVLDTVQICPARPAQRVVAWAIEGLRSWRHSQRDDLIRRAAACRAAFAPLPGWRLDSLGAYFAFAAHPFPGLPAREAAGSWRWRPAYWHCRGLISARDRTAIFASPSPMSAPTSSVSSARASPGFDCEAFDGSRILIKILTKD